MTTLEDLKAEVDQLREVVLMADLDSVETKQILRAHTAVLNAIRRDQRDLARAQEGLRQVFYMQGEAIGELVLTMTSMSGTVKSLGMDVIEVKANMKRLNQRQDRTEERQERTEERQDRTEERLTRMEARQDRMDRNIVAIMGHLGVDSPDEP